jgi:hypothetical protein
VSVCALHRFHVSSLQFNSLLVHLHDCKWIAEAENAIVATSISFKVIFRSEVSTLNRGQTAKDEVCHPAEGPESFNAKLHEMEKDKQEKEEARDHGADRGDFRNAVRLHDGHARGKNSKEKVNNARARSAAECISNCDIGEFHDSPVPWARGTLVITSGFDGSRLFLLPLWVRGLHVLEHLVRSNHHANHDNGEREAGGNGGSLERLQRIVSARVQEGKGDEAFHDTPENSLQDWRLSASVGAKHIDNHRPRVRGSDKIRDDGDNSDAGNEFAHVKGECVNDVPKSVPMGLAR